VKNKQTLPLTNPTVVALHRRRETRAVLGHCGGAGRGVLEGSSQWNRELDQCGAFSPGLAAGLIDTSCSRQSVHYHPHPGGPEKDQHERSGVSRETTK
jgi:hypothetical protein